MKKLYPVVIMMMVFMFCPIKAHAATNWLQLWRENREEFYRQGTCTDEKSVEEGLYTNYSYDPLKDAAVTAGASKEVKEKYKKSKGTKSNKSSKSSSGVTGKGYVYGSDELHVTGCPADPETGYTLPGDYTGITDEGNYTDVYGSDELHLQGAGTRPDGYSSAGRYYKED